ncbi:MAG: TonB-dependent receptor [Thermoanaerobaculia bacterium]|nr:TonB-dependent receptor [Thermoanaerobaculia bacterium]
MRKIKFFAIAALACLLVAPPLLAQADLTGELRGTVKLEDGAVVPGVLVTATSPAALGARTTTTGETGQWLLRNLPPGAYTVTFELEGFATVQSAAKVELGQATPVNVTMGVAAEKETIVVTGELPSVLASSEVSTTYDFEEVNNLPINRTPDAIAALAPGLTTNTPNGGQVTISGAFAYDNVFLIDGVDANDNLFGSTNPVYVEDAIADIQVLTSGISAEYGRFTGGVINVITKSGGNEFSGTLRADLTNEDWRELTPVEEEDDAELPDDISEVYSGTIGGYVMKDTLWFFGSGRDEESTGVESLSGTGLQSPLSTTEERYSIKGTVNIANRHQVQGTYTDRDQTGVRPSFSFSATPDTSRTRVDPSDLTVARYSGALSSSLFAELQYSEKTFQFNNTHGLDASEVVGSQSWIENSPFFDFAGDFGRHYNAPYFDGKDPENRDNEQLAASLSGFFEAGSLGTHDVKVGYEDFSSFRTGGNSQSPTGWVVSAQVVRDANGDPVITADNDVIPDFIPGTTTRLYHWLADRSAEIEINTKSFFVNDRWQLNDKWSFNVGFRYEDVSSLTNTNIVTVDTDAIVPRLAASYDVRGDGKYRFDLTYAQYAGKYSESQFAENTGVGNPASLVYEYAGPAGSGYDFAPAYDLNNYTIRSASDGTQNVFVADNISSPLVDEITLSAGMELERGGFVKAIYTNREYGDFVEDFVTVATGSTEVIVEGVSAGTFSNEFFENSDLSIRDYEALQLIGRYRVTDNWTLDGHWTYQIANEGNFEGEGINTPGISSVLGDYPEIRIPSLHYPTGNLNDYQEHKIRVWSNYNLDFGRIGNLNVGVLANYDSPRTSSTTDTIALTAEQIAILDPLYVDSPASQDIFFGERGNIEWDSVFTVDLSLNYQIPIVKDFELWLKADVFNIFDESAQIDGENGVSANFDGPLTTFGLPTTFTPDDDFGRATSNAHYNDPREYQFTVGFRF